MYHIYLVECRMSLTYSRHIQTVLTESFYLQGREIRHTVANSLNCLQTKQHGIDLGAYLGQ